MRRNISWQVFWGVSLLAASVVLYVIHYMIFKDPHHIFIYMVGDLAFLPIEVLLVTFIIHRVLSEREKRERMEKLNMVIGTFFSEVGTTLLAYFSDLDPKLDSIRQELIVRDNWSQKEFTMINNHLRKYDYQVEVQDVQLEHLAAFLVGKREFLLRIMENPSLLEHESFADLMQAVFHLTEELAARGDMCQITETDCQHLAGDIRRVYSSLVHQWLDYMQHLKTNYPYYFNFAMRINPFDQNSSPIVK